MKKIKPIKGYMCGIAYEWELGLGGAFDGVRVYPSKKAIQHYSKCCKDCGIVSFDMVDFKWVQKQKPFSAKNCMTTLETTVQQIKDTEETILKKQALLERLQKELAEIKAAGQS